MTLGSWLGRGAGGGRDKEAVGLQEDTLEEGPSSALSVSLLIFTNTTAGKVRTNINI